MELDDLADQKWFPTAASTLLVVLQAFNAKECFRVVLMMPDKEIEEAMQRIQLFCSRHYSRVAR